MVFIFFVIGCILGFIFASAGCVGMLVGSLVIEELGDDEEKWRLEFSQVLPKVSKRKYIMFKVEHRDNNNS